MNIKDCVDFVNFWIRKERGAFYTIEEAVSVIDRGQMAFYNDNIPKYAISQIIKDRLSPFKATYTFNTGFTDPTLVSVPNLFLTNTITADDTSVGNLISVTSTLGLTIGQVVIVSTGTGLFQPDTTITKIIDSNLFTVDIEPITPILAGATISVFNNVEFLDLLDLTIKYTANGRDTYYSVKMTNEDELGDKLNSQINPPVSTAPVGAMVSRRTIRLYPGDVNYIGNVYYMRRPKKPVYGYSVVGGRNIVYDPQSSVQLEWRDSDINYILLKALSSIGINLSDQEVSQFAELKSSENYQGVNHL
jgi:hypothetical protein